MGAGSYNAPSMKNEKKAFSAHDSQREPIVIHSSRTLSSSSMKTATKEEPKPLKFGTVKSDEFWYVTLEKDGMEAHLGILTLISSRIFLSKLW